MPAIPTENTSSRSGPYERYVPPARIRLASSARSAAGPAFDAAVPVMTNPATSVSYGMNVLSTYPSRWQRVIADFERDLEAETEEDVLSPLCCCPLANAVYRMKTSSSYSLWRPSISKRSSCGERTQLTSSTRVMRQRILQSVALLVLVQLGSLAHYELDAHDDVASTLPGV